MNVILPPSRSVYIEINGDKLASVEECKETSKQVNRYIECIGEKEPAATAYGKITHSVEIFKVSVYTNELENGTPFYDLQGFELVINVPGKRIVYSGCQWSSITRSLKDGNSFLEQAVINAAERTETIV